MTPLLIVRAEPGASQSAERAAALGTAAVTVPLFAASAVAWQVPEPGDHDAIMLTSAHAARLGGPGLRPLLDLPCYAVGDSSGAAAAEAGFADVRSGQADGAALLEVMAEDGIRHPLHLCGRDRKAYANASLTLAERVVYAVDGVDALPEAAATLLASGAVVLLHSPRAAAHFAMLADQAGVERGRNAIAAISPDAAACAGVGWSRIATAPIARDEPLLELAAKLCKTGEGGGTAR